MKGDFARVTFDPARHYSQVLQQQGRVLLDADWNEQGHIQLHLLRALIRDLAGPCWAVGDGFSLISSTTDANGATNPLLLADWQLTAGHFYVDGILCENEMQATPVTLATQPYRPTPDYVAGTASSGFENPPDSYALYLDVWERHLSAVEAPAIDDVALNGVDTCSRAQVIWQVRMLAQAQADQQLDDITTVLKLRLQASTDPQAQAGINESLAAVRTLRDGIDGKGNGDPCAMRRQLLGARRQWALPRLSAQLGPVASDSDPCVIAADAGYRGMENQLYRVEIHQGGAADAAGAAGGASFKWSRENGSVIFPLVSSVLGATASDGSAQVTVTLARAGRDARLGLAINDWVELVDDDYTLAQRAYPLLQVIALDLADGIVTLNVPKNLTPYQPASDLRKHPLLRRWDQSEALDGKGAVAVAEGAPITLENGIQVSLALGGIYATGDYWLIPSRVAGNGVLDWPSVTAADGSTAPAALPPRGLHHYAPLGIIGDQGAFQDCCCRFDSLCALLRNAALGPAPPPSKAAGAKAAAAPAVNKAIRKPARVAKKARIAGSVKSG
jgi:hypothetical protein